MLDELDVRLREVEEEEKLCTEFLTQFEAMEAASEEELSAATAELEKVGWIPRAVLTTESVLTMLVGCGMRHGNARDAQAKAQNAALLDSLASNEDERSTIRTQLEKQEEEARRLNEEENRHWLECVLPRNAGWTVATCLSATSYPLFKN